MKQNRAGLYFMVFLILILVLGIFAKVSILFEEVVATRQLVQEIHDELIVDTLNLEVR